MNLLKLGGPTSASPEPRHSLAAVLPLERSHHITSSVRLLVLLEAILQAREQFPVRDVKAEPAGGEAAVAVRLLPGDQRRELERLGDRYAADLSRGYLGEHAVARVPAPA